MWSLCENQLDYRGSPGTSRHQEQKTQYVWKVLGILYAQQHKIYHQILQSDYITWWYIRHHEKHYKMNSSKSNIFGLLSQRINIMFCLEIIISEFTWGTAKFLNTSVMTDILLLTKDPNSQRVEIITLW